MSSRRVFHAARQVACNSARAPPQCRPGLVGCFRNSSSQVDDSWRATFNYFDVDQSGCINASEMRESLRALGMMACDKRVKQMLDKADVNSDGRIEYPEFVKMMSDADTTKLSKDAVQRFFNVFDKDGSGYITTAEFCHSLVSMKQNLTDYEMNKIMDRYDLSGDGQLQIEEFEMLLEDLGITKVERDPPKHVIPHKESGGKTDAKVDLEQVLDLVPIDDPRVLDALKPLVNASGKLRLEELQSAMDVWRKKSEGVMEQLHWDDARQRRGLGEVIHKANHIALIVSDVAKSAAFYANVIGLQQIRRPDFDRHGAWFTMGNMELHLIKGTPIVHSGDDLIVGHISIETHNIDRVPGILEKLQYPFRQNVSVPKGKMAEGSGTNASNTSNDIVKQYFLTDPDGYYIEICNCDVLTKYCLGDIEELSGYDQGVSLESEEAAVVVNLGLQLAQQAQKQEKNMERLGKEMSGCSIPEIAEALGCTNPEVQADEEKLTKLLVRRTVYGDVCQNETEESLRAVLVAAGNHLPTAMAIMEVRAVESQAFAPPAFYDGGVDKVEPKVVKYSKSAVLGGRTAVVDGEGAHSLHPEN